MSAVKRVSRRAFTLIELLVVVAIIALLISILLPSLKCAREKARTAKCGVQLRSFGTGLQAYASESNDWIPGINTTGVETTAAQRGSDAGLLRRHSTPVQNYDWMSPLVRHETELGNNRAQRFGTLINEYRCPSFQGLKIDQPYPPNPSSMADGQDFTLEVIMEYAPISYLMPAHFQWWGRKYAGVAVAQTLSAIGRPITVMAAVSPNNFEVVTRGHYQSRLDKVGPPARKIAAADGLRYMLPDGSIDFDVSPAPTWFGAFTSSGAWWAGSTAYGVRSGSANWDGMVMNQGGANPPAQGKNLVWSYRHGCSSRDKITQGVRENPGSINALFFDGHVALLDDRASRELEYWYPTGATVEMPGEGLTRALAQSEVP